MTRGQASPLPPHLLRSHAGLPSCSGRWSLHSLKMTMDSAGLLLLTSPDKVTIGLLSWDGPGKGLRLLLQDTDRFSSHVGGALGMLSMAGLRASSETTSACEQAVPLTSVCLPASLCLFPSLTCPLYLRPVLPGRALGSACSSR